MNVQQWLLDFRAMHEKARGGKLSDSERASYMNAREQFARSLVASQGLAMEPGKSARQSFRVAQGLQIDLEFAQGKQRAMTLDLSLGGFSVMLARPPDPKDPPGFSLRLPGTQDPLIGRARVANVQQRPGSCRASFAFTELSPRDTERFETVLFDLVLARLG
jgi:hypothetical protein